MGRFARRLRWSGAADACEGRAARLRAAAARAAGAPTRWKRGLRSLRRVADGDVACVGAASEGWKLDEGRPFDIVPYSLVVKLRSKLLAKRYKIVVCDESHFLKDRRAQRTQAVMPLLKDANRAICLTGTPALSRPIELFTQLEALVPKVFARLNEYGARYCANGGPFGMYTGCTHADELHVMISKLCMAVSYTHLTLPTKA